MGHSLFLDLPNYEADPTRPTCFEGNVHAKLQFLVVSPGCNSFLQFL